jgi:NAD(P)-dependent dehydrogenase (short-subunit alcohol dehydrogenase family)
MEPRPHGEAASYRPSGKLRGKAALITGGDSGIGRAVAVAFAKEGADVAVVYLDEHEDAEETRRLVEAAGTRCLLLHGDIGREAFCRVAVQRTVDRLGRLDVLINNAAEQHPEEDPARISAEQVERTFRTNIFAAFHFLRYALPHLGKGASIISTTSVVAYRGSPHLIDYAATKGAQLGFTRALALALADRGIRVNAVAPGPIWTPLIAATFPPGKVASFGSNTPMGRAGEPDEVAPAFVYLASDDASYVSGQCLHVNGGEVVNG